MKQFFSIMTVLLLCMIMSVPALAAEQYEFYPAPVVLPDFDRVEGGPNFLSESTISPGRYTLTCIAGDISETSVPFTLSFSPIDYMGMTVDACLFDVAFPMSGSETFPAALINIPDSGSGFAFVDSDLQPIDYFPTLDYLVLTPVSSDLGDVITSDTLQGALNQLISLLPVVVAVVVGCIGLRKAIVWLQNVLRSS